MKYDWIKIILIATFIGVCLFLGFVLVEELRHEKKYTCITGHVEKQVVISAALHIPMWTYLYVCDEEILRSDYEDYLKHPEKYSSK